MPNLFQFKNLTRLLMSLVIISIITAVCMLWVSQFKLEQTIADLNTKSKTNATVNEVDAKIVSDMDSQALLQASISALSKSVAQIELELADVNRRLATQSGVNRNTSSPMFTKETLYLGSTSTNNREWSETGLEIGINSTQYPAGVMVKLEASLSIIGGEAWVRVKNKSTGAVILLSEISNNTSSASWKLSPSFALHSGGYTYVLEARSTSGETANISGARLIIER